MNLLENSYGCVAYLGPTCKELNLYNRKMFQVINISYPYFQMISDENEECYYLMKYADKDDNSGNIGRWMILYDRINILEYYFNEDENVKIEKITKEEFENSIKKSRHF